jgi:hypothetical protein
LNKPNVGLYIPTGIWRELQNFSGAVCLVLASDVSKKRLYSDFDQFMISKKMKLLYIVPNINNEGGVARVLSVKANYLVEKLGYEVHILTQNEGFLRCSILLIPILFFMIWC